MADALLYLDPESRHSLQHQIRQKLVEAVSGGSFPPGSRLPSSRKLAEQLGVARNTVVLVYDQLIIEGLIESRERSGLFVASDLESHPVSEESITVDSARSSLDWRHRIQHKAQAEPVAELPGDWNRYQYPFIDGQFDESLYPAVQWREASRMALGMRVEKNQPVAALDADDPSLIEEIRTKMLPRRGINARADEILITLGEQNALYLVSRLLLDGSVSVAMEEPGNPRMRNLLEQSGAQILQQPVDEFGIKVDKALDGAEVLYLTPSHQVPTAVTLSAERRKALLQKARAQDQIIIEDDFEHESNYQGQPSPALRSMDPDGRVIYVSGFPKVLAPGFRMGFIVASPDFIREARRLRQHVIGRPSLINQRTAAFFLSLGHYDAFMKRLKAEMQQRWFELKEALNHYQGRNAITIPNQGGTCFWVHLPEHVSLPELVENAARQGILIEPDTRYYAGGEGSRNWFRMGVTSIRKDRIRAGVQNLSEIIWEMTWGERAFLDPDDPHLLGPDRLRDTLADTTIVYRTVFGESCAIEIRADGTLKGTAGHQGEDCDRGRWWVEGDTWYRHWDRWAYNEIRGFRVAIENHRIYWYSPENRLADEAEILFNKNPLA